MVFVILALLTILGQDISTIILCRDLYILNQCNKTAGGTEAQRAKADGIVSDGTPRKLLIALCVFHAMWIILMTVIYYLMNHPAYFEKYAISLLLTIYVLGLNGFSSFFTSALGYISLRYHLKKYVEKQKMYDKTPAAAE